MMVNSYKLLNLLQCSVFILLKVLISTKSINWANYIS
ncbi:Uncharacterised protein [Psychrobacter phenylpyruvicus]|uniref:Uncharacterized protein n=1 Tax=Psychrobacter phenylpyruvicus TaxID=29432 RepID=A0A379LIU2_9GAMM|nr:Uncharacterised protein [Psychrobacter phenylpyruvicus]SUD98944.1 Uncharacterised protein [Psychrobacter phenylpyruvicus]